jgi:hypothetical protein
MTAINTIRQSHTVHIVSDGAFCNDDGIILEIGPNAFPLPHIPAAVAIRGATHFLPFLIYRLCRDCGSFDELLSKIVGAALEVHISFPMMLGTLGFGNVTPDFDLVVVGWSAARGKPESYLVTKSKAIPARATGWSTCPMFSSLHQSASCKSKRWVGPFRSPRTSSSPVTTG